MKSTNYTLTRNSISLRRKIYGIAGAIATLVIPFIIMRTDDHVETAQSICPFKMLTGMPCPGCGITKSFISFYHGDIVKSLSYHIFGPLVILFAMITIIVLTAEIVTRREYFNKILFSKKLAYVLGATLAIYHLIRTVYFFAGHSFAEILKESIWA